MIPYINDVIFILGMCVRKAIKICVFLCFSAYIAAFFGSCDAIDSLLPSAGTYKINIQINGTPLDECSYARQSDKISPYFMEPVSNDPDVTALMVYLRDSMDEIVGWKVLYNIDPYAAQGKEKQSKEKDDGSADETAEEEIAKDAEEPGEDIIIPVSYKNGDELIIPVLSLDKELPSFPIPQNTPIGRYTMVSLVMSGKNVLQRTEKIFFYLGKTVFSFKGINAYLPGIADSLQLIPRGTVVMLEADMEFDKKLDPYIVWYDGKNKIEEGNYSKGAGQIFWTAPEQSGFFNLRVEIFPHEDFEELAGYHKDISLLISAKEIDLHLISKNISQLVNWYKFEAGLKDSKMTSSAERALKHNAGTKLKWMGVNGTYGLASGYNNIFTLPKTSIPGGYNDWQILFRLNPANSGGVFSVSFNSSASGSVFMHFYIEGSDLILVLTSPSGTVSQTVSLSVLSDEAQENEPAESSELKFLTAGVSFSVLPGLLKAQINIADNFINNEAAPKPIVLEANIKNDFQIMLGFLKESLNVQQKAPSDESESSSEQVTAQGPSEVTAVWDEFALYYMPPMDVLAEDIKPFINKEQPAADLES